MINLGINIMKTSIIRPKHNASSKVHGAFECFFM